MCGIAGYSGTFAPELLGEFRRRLHHRGPDDAGEWHSREAGIGLAHTRLAILDLSPAGHQPMVSSDGRLHVVYNGEIYNFPELRRELEAQGYAFRSHSDTEVLLALYAREGTDFVAKLNGMFAFALWDADERQLFVARDSFGVKPLYFATTPDGFLFASELKALLAAPGIDRRLDGEALRQYMRYLWAAAPRTPLRGVKKVAPGEALLVKNGRITSSWIYSRPPVSPEQVDAPPLTNEREARTAVLAGLRQAVKRQLLSDVPVGAFLSGGLDSSLIVALMREEYTQGEIETFTIDCGPELQKEGFPDDLPYARQAARHLGVRLNEVRVDASICDGLAKMIYHLDEPQPDLAPLLVGEISRGARAQGLKVLLSGAGGDDLFAGYRRHAALSAEGAWRKLPDGVKRALSRLGARLPTGSATFRRVGKLLRDLPLSPEERLTGYYRWIPAAWEAKVFREDFLRDSDGLTGEDPLLRSLQDLPASSTLLSRSLHLDLKHFLADHNLNYTDKMGMAWGIETRVPFLDPDLARTAARVPDALKCRGLSTKLILKQAAESHLPRDLIYRPKTGFGLPLRTWIRHELKPLFDDTLSEANLRRTGIFDPVAVAEARRANDAGLVDASYMLFAIVCIDLWVKQFLGENAALGSQANSSPTRDAGASA